MSAGQPEEDEITWGSDELPIENMNSKSRDGKSDFGFEILLILYVQIMWKGSFQLGFGGQIRSKFQYVFSSPRQSTFSFLVSVFNCFVAFSSRWADHHGGWADLFAACQSGPWWPVHRTKAQHCGPHDEGASRAEGPTAGVWSETLLLISMTVNSLQISTFVWTSLFFPGRIFRISNLWMTV